MTPTDPRHGMRAGYIAGCHEPCCLAPHNRYQKRSRIRLQREGSQIIDARPALNRIETWARYGVSLHALSLAAGVGAGTLIELTRGERTVCLKTTLRAVLAVTWAHLDDASHVNAGITVLRVNSLMAAGHPLTWICDVTPGLAHGGRWRRQARVTLGLARAVKATYVTAPLSGPSKATATKARNRGELHPLAWDDPGLLAMPVDWAPKRAAVDLAPRPHGRPERMATVLEDFDWLTSQGTSAHEAAARVGVALATVEDYRRRAGERAA